jgi:excisionase family DNA binding protein
VSVEQLSERWGTHHKTIREAINRGEIPSTRLGRKLMIPTAWVLSQENPTTDPTA